MQSILANSCLSNHYQSVFMLKLKIVWPLSNENRYVANAKAKDFAERQDGTRIPSRRSTLESGNPLNISHTSWSRALA